MEYLKTSPESRGRRVFATTATIFLLAGLTPLLSGCSDPDICRISGQVTYNGQPVKTGSISFEPADGKSQVQGMLIRDGRYASAAKATINPGNYIVRIFAPDLSRSKPKPNRNPFEPSPPTVPLLPPTWNKQSKLSVELKAGKNIVNFSGEKMGMPLVEVPGEE